MLHCQCPESSSLHTEMIQEFLGVQLDRPNTTRGKFAEAWIQQPAEVVACRHGGGAAVLTTCGALGPILLLTGGWKSTQVAMSPLHAIPRHWRKFLERHTQ